MNRNPPNILFLMSDQMSALALPMYAGQGALTPHLDALAERGTRFENAYCAFPLCGPSRAAMMTGRLPSRIGAYDNGSDFPSHVSHPGPLPAPRGLLDHRFREAPLRRGGPAPRLRGAS